MKIGVRSAVKVVCIMAVAVESVSILGRTPLLQLFLDANEAGGTEALFVSEPAAWLFGLLLLMLPYFYYQKKLLMT